MGYADRKDPQKAKDAILSAASQLSAAAAAAHGKVPPNDLEAERAVLGSILLDNVALANVEGILAAGDFYHPAHGVIYEAVQAIAARREPVDVVTLAAELRARERLNTVGGAQYLGELTDTIPTIAHVESHARIVADLAGVRRMIEVAHEIIGRGYGERGNAEAFLDYAASKVFEVAQKRAKSTLVPLDQVILEAFERLEHTLNHGARTSGTETGFRDLDALTAGMHGGQLIIIAARPAMGKCLAADSEIVLDDGSVATIEELYRRGAARLLTLRDDLTLAVTSPSHYVDDGVKPVFRVTTRLGRQVETTLTHPFLTVDGWRPLAEIPVGARVAVPRVIPVFGDRAIRDCEAALLGYLLGDGSLTGTSPSFTNTDPRVLEDFRTHAMDFGDVVVREERRRRVTPVAALGEGARSVPRAEAHGTGALKPAPRAAAMDVCYTAGFTEAPASQGLERAGAVGFSPRYRTLADGRDARAPLTNWLRAQGVWGCDAHTKFVPACVFTAPRRQVALFLNRMFATSGWAAVLATGQASVGYATASERLGRQVQHLLLRFGIVAALRRRSVKYDGARRAAWQVELTDADAIRTFASEVGIFGREAALARVVHALDDRQPCVEGVWSRARLGAPCLERRATSDVYWDEIVAIEPMGAKQVYDLTVPDTHNFVANDVCVHNTSLVLNLAMNAAVSSMKPVLVFSLEMPRIELANRLMCAEARVDQSRLRTNLLTQEEVTALTSAANKLHALPMYIDDSGDLTLLELRSKSRRIKSERDMSLIIIDYLQLMKASREKMESREREISEISRGLKSLAKELDVPIIALSQLNRACETRPGKDKRPMLADLRESGAIEQDADVVMFIYRDEVYNRDTEDKGIAELIIAKQRNGPTDTVRLRFIRELTKFENLAMDDGGPYHDTQIGGIDEPMMGGGDGDGGDAF